ncbi:50S ribosomal protein L32e [Candidatus Bathyarchaeota archaeon]|jgi:large subunit ribosomal protein L32e|nr:50S ribosomal protein L32e [Candidatus Bathyarchaeota archaeon]
MTAQTNGTLKRALRLRKRMKQKKPNFVRPESWRYVRIKENWRRPRGLDHKVRLMYDGWPPGVSIGYRSPKATRGLHPSGYREVLVFNVEGLKNVDPKTQAIRIAHTVGKRKRVKILAEAKRKRLTILNVTTIKEKAAEEKEPTEQEKLEMKEEQLKMEEDDKPKQKREKPKRAKETEKQ